MKPPRVSWGLYLRNGLARRVSMLGERLGRDSLIYNPLAMRKFHDDARRDAPLVANAVIDLFPTEMWLLDVGCGGGAFAAEFNRLGRHAIGLERSPHGRALAQTQRVDCRTFDLTRAIPADVREPIELVYCFEVAEHLRSDLGDKLVEFIAGFRKPVIFSAARPGQGGTGHVNEQPLEYWLARFAKLEFSVDKKRSDELRGRCKAAQASHWFHSNPMVLLPK